MPFPISLLTFPKSSFKIQYLAFKKVPLQVIWHPTQFWGNFMHQQYVKNTINVKIKSIIFFFYLSFGAVCEPELVHSLLVSDTCSLMGGFVIGIIIIKNA